MSGAGAGDGRGMEPTALTVFLVAAEESGDRLGAALMRALARAPRARCDVSGIGGRDMAAEGLTDAGTGQALRLHRVSAG